MIFGQRGDLDDSQDETEPVEDPPHYISLHHHVPMTFGGNPDSGLLLPPPPVNPELAYRPISPGMPPIFLPAPFDPNSLRLLPPPGTINYPDPSRKRGTGESERILFPTSGVHEGAVPASAEVGLSSSAVPSSNSQPRAAAVPQRTWGDRVDPLIALFFYLALALGTAWAGVTVPARYTFLWTLLIGLGAVLTLIDSLQTVGTMSSSNMVWGLGIGLVLGLPLFILAREGLAATTQALYPDFALPALFQSLVIVGPIGETLFFRGVLQEKRGVISSILGAGLNYLIFFFPLLIIGVPAILVGAGLFYLTILAAVYSYVRSRYGITAAFVCQATINLMLFFLPFAILTITELPRTP
jgi:hypothetical protein